MKIRRYLGSNTQEAILKVKKDLGSEAIILNTRKVRQKGLFKIFAKPMVEVLAAIDEDYGTRRERQEIDTKKKFSEIAVKNKPESKLQEKEGKISELENKVSNMECLLHKIYNQIQVTDSKQNDQIEQKQLFPKVLQLFYNNLIKNEVEADIATQIIQRVSEEIGQDASVSNTASVLYNIISDILGKPETIRLREDGKPTVVIFVGPTGVGKTTTLAKIAASYVLNDKKRVGFITTDTYRIAAVEQLKIYADILGIPVSVIYSVDEIENAINMYKDKDLILIDTAGRSHKNKSQFEEMKSLIDEANADEIYLLLSTNISYKNCKDILENYSFLKDYKFIFTKLDETSISGTILNSKYITNKNLSYVTTGQSVPDDIEIADIDKLTKNLLGSIN